MKGREEAWEGVLLGGVLSKVAGRGGGWGLNGVGGQPWKTLGRWTRVCPEETKTQEHNNR